MYYLKWKSNVNVSWSEKRCFLNDLKDNLLDFSNIDTIMGL
jgi:hypothetical protein